MGSQSSWDAGDGAAYLRPRAPDGRPYWGFDCSGQRSRRVREIWPRILSSAGITAGFGRGGRIR